MAPFGDTDWPLGIRRLQSPTTRRGPRRYLDHRPPSCAVSTGVAAAAGTLIAENVDLLARATPFCLRSV